MACGAEAAQCAFSRSGSAAKLSSDASGSRTICAAQRQRTPRRNAILRRMWTHLVQRSLRRSLRGGRGGCAARAQRREREQRRSAAHGGSGSASF